MGEQLHILERIENDEVLRLAWEQLDSDARQMSYHASSLHFVARKNRSWITTWQSLCIRLLF